MATGAQLPDSYFDSICNPCIISKQTQVVMQNKLMTEATINLEKVQADLWGPHYLSLLFGKTYATILLDATTQKSWIVYLKSKDEFVNIFKTWLPKVENKSGQSMKVLRVDSERDFILAKVRSFCEKKGIIIK